MDVSRGHRNDVGQVSRNCALAIVVVAPGRDRAVAPQRQGVVRARRHCDRFESGGHVALAVPVVAPGPHRAVGQQRGRMVVARGDRHGAVEIRRRITFAVAVVAPRRHGAVGHQRQREIISRRDGDGIGNSGGARNRPVVVLSPGRHRAAGEQRQGVVRARRQADGVGDVFRRRIGVVAVVAPAVKPSRLGVERRDRRAGGPSILEGAGHDPRLARQIQRRRVEETGGGRLAPVERVADDRAGVGAGDGYRQRAAGGDERLARFRREERRRRLLDVCGGTDGADPFGTLEQRGPQRRRVAQQDRGAIDGRSRRRFRPIEGVPHRPFDKGPEPDRQRSVARRNPGAGGWRAGDGRPLAELDGRVVSASLKHGGVALAGRHVALAILVVAPGRHRTVGSQRRRMVLARGHGHRIRKPGRHDGLAVPVVAPGGDRAVGPQRQRMVDSRSHGDRLESGGHVALAVPVVAPGRHRAVEPQRRRMVIARGQRHRVGEAGRRVALAVAVVAPADNRAVAQKRQRMVRAGGQGDGAGEAGRHVALAVAVVAPGGDRAVGPQRQRVARARGQRHHVGEAGRHIALAVAVVAPGLHRAVGTQRQAMIGSQREGGGVRQIGRHAALAVVVVSPDHNAAAAHVGRRRDGTGCHARLERPGADHGHRVRKRQRSRVERTFGRRFAPVQRAADHRAGRAARQRHAEGLVEQEAAAGREGGRIDRLQRVGCRRNRADRRIAVIGHGLDDRRIRQGDRSGIDGAVGAGVRAVQRVIDGHARHGRGDRHVQRIDEGSPRRRIKPRRGVGTDIRGRRQVAGRRADEKPLRLDRGGRGERDRVGVEAAGLIRGGSIERVADLRAGRGARERHVERHVEDRVARRRELRRGDLRMRPAAQIHLVDPAAVAARRHAAILGVAPFERVRA